MKAWPLAVACTVFTALLVGAYLRIRARGAGQVFTLDDAYISAGIGRHLLLDHTWGVSPHSFSSASSSILWPLLLAAGFAVFGVHMWVPFALNVVFGFALLWVGWRVLDRELPGVLWGYSAVVLCLVAFVTPLPMMAFVGMEHSGFALASMVFMVMSSRGLAKTHASGGFAAQELVMLGAAAGLACSLRYEGMFEAAVVCGLFLLRRRWLAVLAVAAGAALPIVSFGLFALRHGAHFFPNSLLQKSGGGVAKLLHSVAVFVPNKGLLSHYSLTTGLFALWAVAAVLLVMEWQAARTRETGLSPSMRYALIIFVATVVLHCQFSQLNWLWRYESYLMATGSLFVLVATQQLQDVERIMVFQSALLWRVAMILGIVAAVATFQRGRNSYADIPHSAYAIYEQQYQTGMFLARYYRGQPVVLNDIGVPSFVSDAQILDLAGLGSLEVTDLQIAHRFDTAAIAQLAEERHSRIAILYRKWFKGAAAPPAGWTEVGSWTIGPMDPRVPIADPTFTFFAVTPAEAAYLHESLCANRGYVPADETQKTVTPCGAAGR